MSSFRAAHGPPPPSVSEDARPHVSRVYPGDPEYTRIMNLVRQIDEADEGEPAPVERASAAPARTKKTNLDAVADAVVRQHHGEYSSAFDPATPARTQPRKTKVEAVADAIERLIATGEDES